MKINDIRLAREFVKEIWMRVNNFTSGRGETLLKKIWIRINNFICGEPWLKKCEWKWIISEKGEFVKDVWLRKKRYARGGEFVEKVCISMNNFLWREFPEKAWMKLMMTGKLYVWEGTMSYMEEHFWKKNCEWEWFVLQ